MDGRNKIRQDKTGALHPTDRTLSTCSDLARSLRTPSSLSLSLNASSIVRRVQISLNNPQQSTVKIFNMRLRGPSLAPSNEKPAAFVPEPLQTGVTNWSRPASTLTKTTPNVIYTSLWPARDVPHLHLLTYKSAHVRLVLVVCASTPNLTKRAAARTYTHTGVSINPVSVAELVNNYTARNAIILRHRNSTRSSRYKQQGILGPTCRCV